MYHCRDRCSILTVCNNLPFSIKDNILVFPYVLLIGLQRWLNWIEWVLQTFPTPNVILFDILREMLTNVWALAVLTIVQK